jgi:ectoine hydroxylase-related dioxygenase (phytanoyl-CoA dioxygenase family)
MSHRGGGLLYSSAGRKVGADGTTAQQGGRAKDALLAVANGDTAAFAISLGHAAVANLSRAPRMDLLTKVNAWQGASCDSSLQVGLDIAPCVARSISSRLADEMFNN